MPRHIKSTEDASVGDVVMVHKNMIDRKTKEGYVWRYFGIVESKGGRALGVHRVGGPAGNESVLYLQHDDLKIFLLDESEWPDGLYAYTMMRALDGDAPIDIAE